MHDGETVTAASVEDAIRRLGEGPPDRAVADLTAVANRAIIELHKVARAQANAHRGEPDWGKWARLANAVRSGVLQVAAIRDALKGLGRVDSSSSSAGPSSVEDRGVGDSASDLSADTGGAK